MKRLLLITLLVLSHGPVHAEWMAVEKKYQTPDRQTVYINPVTIHRDGNLVTLMILIGWTRIKGAGHPADFTRRSSRSNSTARTSASVRWRSRSTMAIWRLVERPLATSTKITGSLLNQRV